MSPATASVRPRLERVVGTQGFTRLINLVLAVLPVPAALETLGSTLGNVGLISMGAALLTQQPSPLDWGDRD